jgi:hypothetical protein
MIIYVIMLLFYSVTLYEIGVWFLAIHLLSMVITYVVIDGFAYIKFII